MGVSVYAMILRMSYAVSGTDMGTLLQGRWARDVYAGQSKLEGGLVCELGMRRYLSASALYDMLLCLCAI